MTGTFRFPLRATLLGSALLLSACGEDGQLNFPTFGGAPAVRDDAQAQSQNVLPQGVKLIEQDVESPEVFQATDRGLWDGRPSLGGVWVSYPGVTDPERVIIRNQSNGKFVVGALFKKEAAVGGPKFQVSSDAAQALGMLAGAPVTLNVTALRKQTAPAPTAAAPAPQPAAPAAPAVQSTPLKPADAAPAATPSPAPTPTAPAPNTTSTLAKPFVQLGIFSVEANAKRTAAMMQTAGVTPSIRRQSTQGKTFYRVLIGPATSQSGLTQLLRKAKGAGFSDAYAVGG